MMIPPEALKMLVALAADQTKNPELYRTWSETPSRETQSEETYVVAEADSLFSELELESIEDESVLDGLEDDVFETILPSPPAPDFD
jgi:hypothetical protein